MVGAVAEKSVKGGAVGPTFACIIGQYLFITHTLIYYCNGLVNYRLGEQFRRLKYGDRFFYTHTPDTAFSRVKQTKRQMTDSLDDKSTLNAQIYMRFYMEQTALKLCLSSSYHTTRPIG